ncbi:C2 domain-containing protein [Sporodiniella umbellata]|nr:C2 domain-containing protein [Sporodiniella umbellata]
MSNPASLGELVIVAYKAIVGKQDPFVFFRLGENTRKTKTDFRGGQHPLWDDQVVLPVPPRYKSLIVQVFDEDSKREDLISEGEVDLTKVLEEGEIDDWFPLQYRGRPAGKIYLELTFYSAAPPPKRQPTRFGTRHQKKKNDVPPVPSGAYPPYNPPEHSDSTINRPGQYPPPQQSFYSSGYPPAGHSGGYPPAHTPVSSHSSGHFAPSSGYPSNLSHGYPPAPSTPGYPPAPSSSNVQPTGYPPASGLHMSTGYPPLSEHNPSMSNNYPPVSTPHHGHPTGYPPSVSSNGQSVGIAATPNLSSGQPTPYPGPQKESHKPDSPPNTGVTASLLSSSYNPGQPSSGLQGKSFFF